MKTSHSFISNKGLLLIFFLHVATRLIFIFTTGLYNNYALQGDSIWLTEFADQVVAGNFNFELQRFIASPLFPIVCGIFKIVFLSYWDIALIIFQVALAAISGVFIYKIAHILFNDVRAGLIATFVYAVFPLTLWFTHTFAQESLFQSLFIFSFYYLIKTLKENQLKYVVFSAIYFSLSYLTKSHVLLFSIFIPVIFLIRYHLSAKAIIYSFVYGSIALLFSIPYGIYQYNIGNSYVISSNGSAYQFYLGNTESGYRTVVDAPAKGSEDYHRIKNINTYAGYFNNNQERYDSILALSQPEKQAIFFKESVHWIKENPLKVLKLKIYDVFFFLLPGVNWNYYDFKNWLFSFIVSFPVYLLAYISIVKQGKTNFTNTTPIIFLFISMLLFSTIWYVQNRFRTVTLEPFYIVYMAPLVLSYLQRKPLLNKFLTKITGYFIR